MQIAVRLRRKARVYAAFVLIGGDVVADNLADEVGRTRWSHIDLSLFDGLLDARERSLPAQRFERAK